MAKVGFTKLNLKVNQEVKTFECGDAVVEVLQYLPIEQKYDLLMITLQKANEDGIFNKFKLDMYFHLNLVYLYTNISFTEKQKEDESLIYDKLDSNGILDQITSLIPEDEYTYLFETLEELAEDQMVIGNTAGQVIKKIVNDLPAQAEAAGKIIDSFNKDDYTEVINFARAINAKEPLND